MRDPRCAVRDTRSSRRQRVTPPWPASRARVHPQEIEYCERQADPAESYAARWAAREACRKALGGVRGMRWHDVRVARAPSGAPSLVLEGATRLRADALGVSQVMVALTHERKMAGAFCVAVLG